jgi:hypothetical protein
MISSFKDASFDFGVTVKIPSVMKYSASFGVPILTSMIWISTWAAYWGAASYPLSVFSFYSMFHGNFQYLFVTGLLLFLAYIASVIQTCFLFISCSSAGVCGDPVSIVWITFSIISCLSIMLLSLLSSHLGWNGWKSDPGVRPRTINQNEIPQIIIDDLEAIPTAKVVNVAIPSADLVKD